MRRAMIVRAAVDAWPVAALTLIAGLGVLGFTSNHTPVMSVRRIEPAARGGPTLDITDIADLTTTTWPLVPMILAAACGGVAILGHNRGEVIHGLCRPIPRGSWMMARLLGLWMVLAVAGVALFEISGGVEVTGPGPPVLVVAPGVLIASVMGALAGGVARTETGAIAAAGMGLTWSTGRFRC